MIFKKIMISSLWMISGTRATVHSTSFVFALLAEQNCLAHANYLYYQLFIY